MNGKFAAAINCIDGRAQLPVIEWVKKNCNVDYVDMITEPGPDKLLSIGQGAELASIRSRLLISLNKHGSDTLVIAGHDDCAGNPVSKEVHLKQIQRAVEVIRAWNLPIKQIIGVWVNVEWQVEKVASSVK
jgi:hypothetical protein